MIIIIIIIIIIHTHIYMPIWYIKRWNIEQNSRDLHVTHQQKYENSRGMRVCLRHSQGNNSRFVGMGMSGVPVSVALPSSLDLIGLGFCYIPSAHWLRHRA